VRARARIATLLALVAGCQRVVSIDAPDGPKHLVVEARIERVRERVSGSQTVRLTTTSAYFDDAPPPPATGAIVRVTDDLGTVVTFNESAPGVYVTQSLIGAVGRTYTLAIEYAGDRYEGVDRMISVAPIDSLYFAPAQRCEGTCGGVRATIDFHDPGGPPHWYLWEQSVNGALLLGPDSSRGQPVVANDQGLNGRFVTKFQPFGGIAVDVGDRVVVRQLALSEPLYHYFDAIAQGTSHGGSPFAVPPSSIRGNVANRTNASRFALGYFLATEVSEATRDRPQ
jgi:hypothetical protein